MHRQRRTETLPQTARRFAMARLRADPTRIGEVQALIQRWREPSGSTRPAPYRDEWERSSTLAVDEQATVLRSVSPIGAVISTAERRGLHPADSIAACARCRAGGGNP